MEELNQRARRPPGHSCPRLGHDEPPVGAGGAQREDGAFGEPDPPVHSQAPPPSLGPRREPGCPACFPTRKRSGVLSGSHVPSPAVALRIALVKVSGASVRQPSVPSPCLPQSPLCRPLPGGQRQRLCHGCSGCCGGQRGPTLGQGAASQLQDSVSLSAKWGHSPPPVWTSQGPPPIWTVQRLPRWAGPWPSRYTALPLCFAWAVSSCSPSCSQTGNPGHSQVQGCAAAASSATRKGGAVTRLPGSALL